MLSADTYHSPGEMEQPAMGYIATRQRPASVNGRADGGRQSPSLDVCRRWWPFLLVATIYAVCYAGTNLATPLYGIYEHRYGLSAATITAVFAVYVAGVLTSLLVSGRLSDQVGRRPVLLTALVVTTIGSTVFMAAQGALWLYVGRVLQGLAVGAVSGTAAAALVELHPTKDTNKSSLTVTVVTNLSAGLGPLGAGVLAQYGPLPTRLPWAVHLALLVPLLAAVTRLPETVATAPERPRLRLQPLAIPHGQGRVFVVSAATAFCAFAVAGLFGGLAPTFLARLLGKPNLAVTGLVLLVLFGSSATTQLAARRWSNRATTLTGLVILIGGLGVLTIALTTAGVTELLVNIQPVG